MTADPRTPHPGDEELLQVVDENDQPLAARPRGEVHRERLLHRAVQVGVFNGNGRIWLQHRNLTKDTWPGAWDLAATGHVQAGESYADAARRELAEELNIDAHPHFITMIPASERTGWEFQALFGLRWETRIRDYDRKEIIRMRVFTMDALERILDGGDPRVTLTPGVITALPHLARAMPDRLRADHPRPLDPEARR